MVLSVKELLQKTPPLQFQVLEDLLQVMIQSSHVNSAYIRGSIARNDYDRASDVDLMLVVSDAHFIDVVTSLDDILQQKFSVLLPGWHDKIVPNFGGIGYVYLIQTQERIIQIDIYILPASREPELAKLRGKQKIYEATTKSNNKILTNENIEIFVECAKKERPTIQTQLTELIILANLIKKRIGRHQRFLNFSETQLLIVCLRNLLRLSFDPLFVDYGWYHFEDHLKQDSRARPWLKRFEKMMFSQTTLNSESLYALTAFGIELINTVSPKDIEGLESSLKFLTAYLDPEGQGVNLGTQTNA